MIVGIFSESYEPVTNGVSVSVATLTSELRRLGHRVYVFAPGSRGTSVDETDVIRFPSFRTPIDRTYPVPIPYLPGLSRTVSRLGLDIVHTQTPWMLGWLGLSISRNLGIPLVSTSHTQYPEYAHYCPVLPRPVVRFSIVWLMRNYYNRCDAVIAPSRPMETTVRQYGVRTPIHVIPTGIQLYTARDEAERRRLRARYGIPQDAPVLLYLSRLAKEKNFGLLLRSFGILAERHAELRLLVAGGGSYEQECRRQSSELPSADRIIFAGAVPRSEVASYYSAGDIFALPSTTETQGIVLWEALQSGLPCVAVRAGGCPDMIEEGGDGFLCENDVDDFVEKLDLLLTDRELAQRFSARGVENSVNFTPRAMANRVLSVYDSVLARTCVAQP